MKWRNVLFGLGASAIHLAGVLLTAVYVSKSADGQAPMVWVLWLFADLPWSFLLLDLLTGRWFIIFGLIGSLWWFVLVAFGSRWIERIRGPL
jgi:hypothetical protein